MTEQQQDTAQDVFETTEQTVVGDLMALTLDELKHAQDVWQKLSEDEQDDTIRRVESRVKSAITTVVRMISAQGFTRVPAKIESITIKDGMKAVLLPLALSEDKHALIDAQGQTVTIVLADVSKFVDQPHDHKADPMQGDMIANATDAALKKAKRKSKPQAGDEGGDA